MMAGRSYFRLIRPFVVEGNCLKCHGEQGYRVGDIRGGISLAVPMGPYRASAGIRTLYIGIGLGIVWLLGFGGVFLGMGQIGRRIREREEAQAERDRFLEELQQSLNSIKRLKGLLPICASCKKIRNDKGYWQQIESYVRDHTEADFSHSICPDCAKKLYPEYFKENDRTKGEQNEDPHCR